MLGEKVTLAAFLVASVAENVIAAIGSERTQLARLTVRTNTAFPIGENAVLDENLNDLLVACGKEFLDGAAPFGLLETDVAALVVVLDIRDLVPKRRLHS